MRFAMIFILFTFLSTSWSGVYKTVDDDGNIVYTDSPTNKSLEIHVPESTKPKQKSISKNKSDTNKDKKTEKKPTTYEKFTILTPKDDGAFRSNNGEVTVTFSLTPKLDTDFGHQIRIFLDGNHVGNTASMQFTLKNVDRGTHALHAAVGDKSSSTLIKSNQLTFHLLRYSSIKR